MPASDLEHSPDIPTPARSEDLLAAGERIFGTRSPEFQRTLVRQVLSSIWLPSSKPPEQRQTATQAALWALREIAPRDGVEGLLAAQMVATHNGAMECFRRAMAEGQTFEGHDVNLKHAQRLTKAYLDQLAALDKHRGRGQQKITVEHVTVEAGGQAIVGSVHTSTAGGAVKPRARAGAKAGAAMFEDCDLEAEGGCEGAKSQAGGQRPGAMETITPAKPIKAAAPTPKVKRAARSRGRK